MEFQIYLEDLRPEWLDRIRQVLRYELAEEIKEAVESGLNRQIAEDEIIDGYLNTHNFSTKVEI